MDESTKKKLVTAAAVALGGLCVGAVSLTVRSGSASIPNEAERRNAHRVVTSPVPSKTLTLPLAETGSVAGPGAIEPVGGEVQVASARSGVVTVVHVAEGDLVEKGQPLVTFERDDEVLALKAAELDASMARLELERVRRGGHGPEEVAAVEADARAAQERATLSALLAKRSRRLLEERAATPEEVERTEAQARIDAANAESLAARARLFSKPWAMDIEAAKLRLDQAEAARKRAQHAMDDRTVRAESAGTVLEVLKKPGELYSPSAGALLIMGDTRRLRARVDIDARDVAVVTIGQKATVLVDAFPERPFSGRVVEVARRMGKPTYVSDDPSARKDTRTIEVLIELNDATGLLSSQPVTGYITASRG